MYETDSAYHRLRVTDNAGIRLLRFERNRQSSMYLDDPFETDFEYPGYLHLTMALRPDAARTLVIGLGGGSVVKRMWRDYPRMSLDVVELDPEVVDIARRFFALPDDPRIRIFVEDGRGFIRFAPDVYDIVVVDAFDDDRVPRPLVTEEFMREVRDSLSSEGVVAYNFIGAVYGPHSKPFRSLHRTLSNVWAKVWVFPVGFSDDVTDKSRNIILLATDTALTAEELRERIASRVDGLVTVPKFERFGEDLYQGKVRSGDVPLIIEHPAGRRKRRR
ncbi:MAG TPA: fused MFS/spermidine synthase [Coriobacteriia bacterium]|nr:fused MFS/spermidine synthase [Coriobacteriia bacterium]